MHVSQTHTRASMTGHILFIFLQWWCGNEKKINVELYDNEITCFVSDSVVRNTHTQRTAESPRKLPLCAAHLLCTTRMDVCSSSQVPEN